MRDRTSCSLLFLCVVYLCSSIGVRAEEPSYRLPDEAGVIDVTKPPYNADNTGKTDCSDAIQKAFSHANATTERFSTKDKRAIKILYFPAGTYLITKQLDFQYQADSRKVQNPGFMMIYGESKERSRILLAPDSPVFQDRPRPVIAFTNSKSSNNSYHNSVRNITLEIGENNPGAIGFHFVSSNIGSIENVVCRNLDANRPAYRGISLPVSKGGLSYLTNIRIEGFKTGIYVSGKFPGYTLENISLANQHEAGIVNEGKNIAIRKLVSRNKVPALVAKGEESITTLLDSELNGESDGPAIVAEGHLLLRNIQSQGYGKLLDGKELKTHDGHLSEYCSHTLTLFDDTPATTLNLEIKDTPDYPFPKPHEWTVFDVEKQDDDTAALQKFIDDGAEFIFISGVNQRLKLRDTVFLRGNLQVLHGGWTSMDVENTGAVGKPLFCFQDGKHPVMFFEAFSNAQQRNTFTTFFNERNQTLVIRDAFMGYAYSSYRSIGRGDLFLESVPTGGGNYPHIADYAVPSFKFVNQRVWFRNLNPEAWVPDLYIGEGAQVFGLGGKLGELYGTHLKICDGAQAEIYGLMCNIGMAFPSKYGLDIHERSMTGISIEVEDADISLGCFHDGSHNFPDPTFIKETRNGKSVALAHSDAPLRSPEGKEVVAIHYRSSGGADHEPREAAEVKPPTENEHYVKHTFKTKNGIQIHYWLMSPKKIEEGRQYPLVLALHGLAGNSTAATELGSPELREQFPCFVMAPVSTAEGLWAEPFAEQNKEARATLPVALEAMDAFIDAHAIDPDRIYVTGQSMGGAGTYNAMYYRPDVFAAAIPVCGIQDPNDTDQIMKMAIWAFNGKVGWRTQGNHPWKEVNYRGSGEHCSGARYASRETWEWLFQQKRTK
jgi:dienelactone hydrolase